MLPTRNVMICILKEIGQESLSKIAQSTMVQFLSGYWFIVTCKWCSQSIVNKSVTKKSELA